MIKITGSMSRLSKKCQECPLMITCENKKMEMVAYNVIGIDLGTSESIGVTTNISTQINSLNLSPVSIELLESEAELRKNIYSALGIKL